ncbi:nuclear transport factor 2 family protein [Amycolatopsis samaneae]|uniref:Nuclear transport factor 2 family protein n=1 Tax=Amycolatopsis samaneae TaxID=664691 RepID=A0ABW5GRR9_9PSEU
MSSFAPPADLAGATALYVEVQHFYGRQMRHLDEGEIQQWADTFTEDGVFTANAHPKPQEGRAAIVEGALAAHRKLADQGIRRRHWLGMLQVAEQPDGTIRADSYAIVLAIPAGGQAAVELSCSCADVLVRDGAGLRVRHRSVRRDDLPPR